jgi:hypothetical protein
MDVYIMGVGTVNAVILLCGTNTNTYIHIIVHAQTYRATSYIIVFLYVSYRIICALCEVRSMMGMEYSCSLGLFLLLTAAANRGVWCLDLRWCVVAVM